MCIRDCLKTYSRLSRCPPRVSDDCGEPPSKRQRIGSENSPAGCVSEHQEWLSSSPALSSSSGRLLGALSSDPPSADCETPPSSPPPKLPSPALRTRRPVFSIFRRQERRPITSSTDHGRGNLQDVTNLQNRKPPMKNKRVRLRQMQIDLGQDVHKTCKTCGMDYVPSSVEDLALHKAFHSMNVGGVDFGKAMSTSLRAKRIWPTPGGVGSSQEGLRGFVAVVDQFSPLSEKNKAKRVLDVVNTEMSAVAVNRSGQRRPSRLSTNRCQDDTVKPSSPQAASNRQVADDQGHRSKMFLYIKDDKCVGFCLAERILHAHRVLERATASSSHSDSHLVASRSSSISINPTKDPAILGISRIWTSNAHRHQGIALTLLECARTNHIYGMQLPKAMMAFSQPTESGGRLAENWFGQSVGWRVYVDR